MKNVIVKLKNKGLKWEETPVFTEFQEDNKEVVYQILQQLADLHRKEVRWEFEDFGQGHYIQPNPRYMSMIIVPTKKQLDKYKRRENNGKQ